MVLADSHRISRVPCYSGYCRGFQSLRLPDCHRLWSIFPVLFDFRFSSPIWQSYYPNDAETSLVWAIPRSIATTKGITLVFSSSGYLDVSVLRVRFPPIAGYDAFSAMGCPIRKSAGHRLFAPRHSLSQLITSFFASGSLGIRRTLLFASLSVVISSLNMSKNFYPP